MRPETLSIADTLGAGRSHASCFIAAAHTCMGARVPGPDRGPCRVSFSRLAGPGGLSWRLLLPAQQLRLHAHCRRVLCGTAAVGGRPLSGVTGLS